MSKGTIKGQKKTKKGRQNATQKT